MVSVSSTDFFQKTNFNEETQNQIWMSQITDAHDNICRCWHPFGHLLASIFPPGHADRELTINQILLRDYKEKCLSGGEGETSHGMAPGEKGAIHTDAGAADTEENKIEDLLFAAAAAAEEGQR